MACGFFVERPGRIGAYSPHTNAAPPDAGELLRAIPAQTILELLLEQLHHRVPLESAFRRVRFPGSVQTRAHSRAAALRRPLRFTRDCLLSADRVSLSAV